MDTKQLLEMLKKDLTKWTPEQLKIALSYCDDMCLDMDFQECRLYLVVEPAQGSQGRIR